MEDNTALVADDGEDPVAARRGAVGEIAHAVAARDLDGDRLEEVPGRHQGHDRALERIRQDGLRALDVRLLRLGRNEIVELAVVRAVTGEDARAERATCQEAVGQSMVGDLDESGVDAGLIEVANHGLTHCLLAGRAFRPRVFTGNRTYHREFYDFVPPETQEANIERAQAILSDAFEGPIVTLVPPGNLLQPVTVEIARRHGVRYLSYGAPTR